jgi:hypothetical protein
LSLRSLRCYNFTMKANTLRLVLIFAVLALTTLAFQRPALAVIVTCPAGYTGPESKIMGCCFTAGNPQLRVMYYQYFCVDGLAEDIMPYCTSTACPT